MLGIRWESCGSKEEALREHLRFTNSHEFPFSNNFSNTWPEVFIKTFEFYLEK